MSPFLLYNVAYYVDILCFMYSIPLGGVPAYAGSAVAGFL